MKLNAILTTMEIAYFHSFQGFSVHFSRIFAMGGDMELTFFYHFR